MAAKIAIHRVMVVSLALSACGCCTAPAGRLKALADSTTQLSLTNQHAYEQSAVVERAWVIITQKSGDLTPESFNLESAFAPEIGQHPLGPKEIGARIEANDVALTVIENYLLALSSFSSKDFQSDLDKQVTKLAGSVKSFSNLPQPWAKTAAQNSGILATAIDGLGHAYIEHQRVVALERAMDTSQTPIEQLAAFVITNDNTVRDTLKQMEKYYLKDANLLRPRTPGAERLAFDAYIAGVVDQFNDVQSTFVGLDGAVANLPKAHAELIRSMCSEKPSLDGLKELIGEANRLSKFYKSAK